MRILRPILLVLGVLLAILLVLSLLAPKDLATERSVLIHAPRAVVYDQVRHFKNFENWSPWANLDSNIITRIEGNDGEVGAKYSWKGNMVGTGSEEIVSLKTDEAVNIRLTFLEPFASTGDAYIYLSDADGDTRATWGFKSKMSMPFNVMGLFFDLSAPIGKDYETGLNNLKAVCEASGGTKIPKTSSVKEVDFAGGTYATIRKTVPFADIAQFFSTNYPIIGKEMARNKSNMAGNPFGFYYNYDDKAQKTDMAAAIPMTGEKAMGNGITTVKLPAGKSLCVDYYGDYSKTAPVYDAIEQYARDKHLQTEAPATEEYVTDPMMEKDTAKWLTRICFPIAK